MNKLLTPSVASLFCIFGFNNAAIANGQVQFFGSVSATTCDLSPEVGGAINAMIQLGVAAPSAKATTVSFSLKPKDPTATGCAALDNSKTAHIVWGGNLNGQGLTNQSGNATDAWVELKAINSKNTNQLITSAASTVEFSGDEIKDKGGAKFEATLNGGTTPGNFNSASAFAVTYQ